MQEKCFAATPTTAESYIFSRSPEGLSDLAIENKKCRFIEDEPLFSVIEERLQDKFLIPEESQVEFRPFKAAIQ